MFCLKNPLKFRTLVKYHTTLDSWRSILYLYSNDVFTNFQNPARASSLVYSGFFCSCLWHKNYIENTDNVHKFRGPTAHYAVYTPISYPLGCVRSIFYKIHNIEKKLRGPFNKLSARCTTRKEVLWRTLWHVCIYFVNFFYISYKQWRTIKTFQDPATHVLY